MAQPTSGVWCVPGAVLGDRYRLVREIGQGGMGVVYEARRIGVELTVAIKFLRAERFDSRPDHARFDRERACLSSLRHENVVQLLDFGDSERGPYAVFEFIDGRPLADILDDSGSFEPRRAVDVVLQIGRALQCAHAAGVIHRDVKTSNIMLTAHADGRDLVKVLDFGIAKMDRPVLSEATPTEGPKGTVSYMSPEIARGESPGDELTDIYSIGVVLYELLSGHRPHAADSPNALLHRVMTAEGVPLKRHEPNLPAELLAFVDRMVSSDRRQRPQTVAELIAELTVIAGRLASCQNRSSSDRTAARPASEGHSLARGRALFAIAGLTLGLLLGVYGLRRPDTADGSRVATLEAQSAPKPSGSSSSTSPEQPTLRVTPRSLAIKDSESLHRESIPRTYMRPTVPPLESGSSASPDSKAMIDAETGFDVRNPYE